MKEELYNDLNEEKEEKVDYKELLFKYIIRWPWFVGSVLICLVAAWVYLQYATPIYNTTSSVIIKDDKKGGFSSGDLGVFEDMGVMNTSKNIDNEIEVLRSKSLIKEVVSELRLYVNYSMSDGIRQTDIYRHSPVLVDLSPADAERLSAPFLLDINFRAGGALDVEVTVNERTMNKHFAKLPAVFTTEAGTVSLLPMSGITPRDGQNVLVSVSSPSRVAKHYVSSLTIEPTSKTTSVATVSVKDSDKERGKDFILKLMEIYNRNANASKNEVAENTAHFIDARIEVINRELGSTEAELENFKRKSGLTNLASDAQLAVTEKSEYEKQCVENGTQINLIQYLSDFLLKADNTTVLPANVGLTDTSLSNLITQYNTLVLERNRLLRTSSESNPVIRRLDISIRDTREGLVTGIASVRKGLLITKADLNRQASRFTGLISNAPQQERQFVSIQRRQEIMAGLYLMLLQKREENNITLAATANNAKIIDDPVSDEAPVSPKGKIIYLLALILGIGIPVGIIYVRELFRFRIEGRTDVEKLTTVPILGEVPLATSFDEGKEIAVHENENDLMAETFRAIRTNLLFLLSESGQKVILTTSSVPGEGKSFFSSNLAVSLALLGKKVIIVGLDIRKPGLNRIFGVSSKDKGITHFLANPKHTDLHTLIQPSGVHSNLDLLPGGVIPPNPTELISRPSLEEALAVLRLEYDYVVLDTAPIGMVTDTQLIARVADASIYVCRADYTHKDAYGFINELQANQRLPKLSTVINGVDLKKKKYGYGYGYGHRYGHRYGYGYGYGDTNASSK